MNCLHFSKDTSLGRIHDHQMVVNHPMWLHRRHLPISWMTAELFLWFSVVLIQIFIFREVEVDLDIKSSE